MGRRKVLQILEVRDISEGEIETVDLFRWEMDPAFSTKEKLVGSLKPTGNRMKQIEKWEGAGYDSLELEYGFLQEVRR